METNDYVDGKPTGTGYSASNFKPEYSNYKDSMANEIRNDIQKCMKYYNETSSSMQKDMENLMASARRILTLQRQVRPIVASDVENFIGVLRIRLTFWENQLKILTCNRLMLLKAQLNSGRKRRNFTKSATRILNEYFETHMAEPYPTEQTKIQLAQQCGITVAQVSNWFGNKRIRFRKAFLRNPLQKIKMDDAAN